MTDRERRVNLSDVEAESFCLQCGVAYRQQAGRCTSCAIAQPVPRQEVMELLEQSVPGYGPESLQIATLSALERAADEERFAEVRLLLRKGKIPHLMVGEKGEPLGPDIKDATTLLAPSDSLHDLVKALDRGEWPVDEVEGREEHPLLDDASVELISCTTTYEAEIIKGQLEAAGIPYQVNRMSAQFGLFAGGVGSCGIRVAESDLEHARKVIKAATAAQESRDVEQDGPDASIEQRKTVTDEAADDRLARRERRFRIARWFLYINAVCYLATAPFAFANHVVDAAANLILAVALIVLARWSRKQPTLAFALSFLVLAVGFLAAVISDRPFLVMPGFIAVLAVYFAHKTASEAEREERVGRTA
jgi:hypothetical protein